MYRWAQEAGMVNPAEAVAFREGPAHHLRRPPARARARGRRTRRDDAARRRFPGRRRLRRRRVMAGKRDDCADDIARKTGRASLRGSLRRADRPLAADVHRTQAPARERRFRQRPREGRAVPFPDRPAAESIKGRPTGVDPTAYTPESGSRRGGGTPESPPGLPGPTRSSGPPSTGADDQPGFKPTTDLRTPLSRYYGGEGAEPGATVSAPARGVDPAAELQQRIVAGENRGEDTSLHDSPITHSWMAQAMSWPHSRVLWPQVHGETDFSDRVSQDE
jgi:hypothetical protein